MSEVSPGSRFALSGSRGFAQWLAGTGGSLALTSHTSDKLLFFGTTADNRLSWFERSFSQPMGLCLRGDGRSLALATSHEIHRFDNILADGETNEPGFDAVFVPHATWTTGLIDAHDIGFGADGRPIFVSSAYSCIATISDSHSFRPLWTPPFITGIVRGDRCHLNGMAMEEGRPRYATAVAQTDCADAWRDHRAGGGVVIDVENEEIIVEGLSMPHSPRLLGGRMWLNNSGMGQFGFVDLAAGRFEPVAFCPGFARGLGFAAGKAIVGLSEPRQEGAFVGLPLDGALAARGVAPRCGLAIIDLVSGELTDWLTMSGDTKEIYDVVFLPGIRHPSAVGFKTDEIKRTVTIEA